MVYSTCSLTTAQNEDVVRWLLEQEPSARLTRVPLGTCEACTACGRSDGLDGSATHSPVLAADGRQAHVTASAAAGTAAAVAAPTTGSAAGGRAHRCSGCGALLVWDGGLVPLTLRFNPLRSGTSGLFIARFRKASAS